MKMNFDLSIVFMFIDINRHKTVRSKKLIKISVPDISHYPDRIPRRGGAGPVTITV